MMDGGMQHIRSGGPMRAMPLAGLVFLVVLAPSVTAQSRTPTFYEDVLPILQQNCQACHQPEGRNMGGMVAPFALLTYDDARRYARSMARAVSSGYMPPWSAA